jgi:hypothetical protein
MLAGMNVIEQARAGGDSSRSDHSRAGGCGRGVAVTTTATRVS